MKERRGKWLRLGRVKKAKGMIREAVEKIRGRERIKVVRVRKGT